MYNNVRNVKNMNTTSRKIWTTITIITAICLILTFFHEPYGRAKSVNLCDAEVELTCGGNLEISVPSEDVTYHGRYLIYWQ
jgi:hypothetical protein